jgi:hypothetical protein
MQLSRQPQYLRIRWIGEHVGPILLDTTGLVRHPLLPIACGVSGQNQPEDETYIAIRCKAQRTELGVDIT